MDGTDLTYDAGQFGITDQVLAHRFGAYRDRFGPLPM